LFYLGEKETYLHATLGLQKDSRQRIGGKSEASTGDERKSAQTPGEGGLGKGAWRKDSKLKRRNVQVVLRLPVWQEKDLRKEKQQRVDRKWQIGGVVALVKPAENRQRRGQKRF